MAAIVAASIASVITTGIGCYIWYKPTILPPPPEPTPPQLLETIKSFDRTRLRKAPSIQRTYVDEDELTSALKRKFKNVKFD